MTEPSKYADILRALADGKQVQVSSRRMSPLDPITWADIEMMQVLGLIASAAGVFVTDLRIRPATMTITSAAGSWEFSEPLRVAPAIGSAYWIVDVDQQKMVSKIIWDGDSRDVLWLKRGLCHLTEEAAEAHASALILASGGTL